LPLSSYALIVANLVPLAGVVFFQWDAVLVLALFWIENLIIGLFTVAKMLAVTFIAKERKGLLLSLFFIFHYGLFCSVHGRLLIDLLTLPPPTYTDYFSAVKFGLFEVMLEGLAVMLKFIDELAPEIWLGIAALSISRLGSFIENFILRGGVFTVRINKLMSQPYSQIVVMHVGLILGALLLQHLGSPVWLLALIVALKMVIDFQQHRRRHKLNSALASKHS